MSRRPTHLRSWWALAGLVLLGLGPLGPFGVFHAEVETDVCVIAPPAEARPAPALDAAPNQPVPVPQGHCAVCHWMHSLRAFGVSPLVVATVDQVTAPVAPAASTATCGGVRTLRSSRAPPDLV